MSETREARRVRYQHSGLARRLRAWVNPCLLHAQTAKPYNLGRSLVVAGSPRSGTTWLSELLATLPGAAVLFEPLQSERVPEARNLGFHRGTCLRPGQRDEAKRRYLERALRGEVLNDWTISRISLLQGLRRQFWIVKFVHANTLLGWLARSFPIRPPALILRHPCAVVASQLKMWHAHCWREHELADFRRMWSEFDPVFERLRTPAQWLAACWCIEQFVPLSEPAPRPLRVVSYERLVREGEFELRRLLSQWNLRVPPAALDRLYVASTTTQRDSHLLGKGDPLGGWQQRLTSSQVDQILEVVQAFGLDFYSESLEPDYERLYGDAPVRLPASRRPHETRIAAA